MLEIEIITSNRNLEGIDIEVKRSLSFFSKRRIHRFLSFRTTFKDRVYIYEKENINLFDEIIDSIEIIEN